MSPAFSTLQSLCASHERMARLAEDLDWDALLREWEPALRQLSELEQRSLLTTLEANEKPEAARMIEQLLNVQQKIAQRAKPWMDDVRPLLQSFTEHPLPTLPTAPPV